MLRNTIPIPSRAVDAIRVWAHTQHALRSALCVLCSALCACTVRSVLCALCCALCALHCAFCAVRSALCPVRSRAVGSAPFSLAATHNDLCSPHFSLDFSTAGICCESCLTLYKGRFASTCTRLGFLRFGSSGKLSLTFSCRCECAAVNACCASVQVGVWQTKWMGAVVGWVVWLAGWSSRYAVVLAMQ